MIKVLLCGWGTPGEGVLHYLINRPDIIPAVCTHPVQRYAYEPSLTPLAKSLGVWSTEESVNTAKLPFKPDVIASIYYRYIIKSRIINNVGGKIFNAHPSLLPQHRGCGSITWALINGDQMAGITYHYITPGIDDGAIIIQQALQIRPTETQASLAQRCADLIVRLFGVSLNLVLGGYEGTPQQGMTSYHHRGTPYDGEINPNWPVTQVDQFIRAFDRPPLPYAKYKGREIKSMNDYIQAKKELG